jgi:hypothetical protein
MTTFSTHHTQTDSLVSVPLTESRPTSPIETCSEYGAAEDERHDDDDEVHYLHQSHTKLPVYLHVT